MLGNLGILDYIFPFFKNFSEGLDFSSGMWYNSLR